MIYFEHSHIQLKIVEQIRWNAGKLKVIKIMDYIYKCVCVCVCVCIRLSLQNTEMILFSIRWPFHLVG